VREVTGYCSQYAHVGELVVLITAEELNSVVRNLANRPVGFSFAGMPNKEYRILMN
jgi:hypothetical protein